MIRRRVRGEFALVSESSLCKKGGVERHDHYGGPSDEQRFETEGTDVGYVGYGLFRIHRGIMRLAGCCPVNEHAQQHAEPYQS